MDQAHTTIVQEILAEVKRASQKHPQWPIDPFHGLGILMEEVGELAKAVIERTYSNGGEEAVREEAIQVAAMAFQFIKPLSEYIYAKSLQIDCNASPSTDIHLMTVNLTYFKKQGKFYSKGSYQTHLRSLWAIWDQVKDLASEGNLPDLEGSHGKEFSILVDVPEHSHNHPQLIHFDQCKTET